MGLNLRNIGKKLTDVLGGAVDYVVPGNQSYLHNGSSPQQAVQQATRQVNRAVSNPIQAVNRGFVSPAAQNAQRVAQIVSPFARKATDVATDTVLPTIGKGIDTAVGLSPAGNTVNTLQQNVNRSLPNNNQVTLPKPSEAAAGFVQAIPQAGARVTNTIMGQDSITPRGKLETTLLGNKPVGQLKDYSQENFGVKTGNTLADTGIGAVGSILDVGVPGAPKVVKPVATAVAKPIVRTIGAVADDLKVGAPILRTQTGAIGKDVSQIAPQRPVVAIRTPEVAPTTKRATDILDEQLRSIGVDPSSPDVGKSKLASFYKTRDLLDRGVDKARDAVGGGIQAAQQSDNAITARVANAPRQVFARFGLTDESRGVLDKFQANKTAAGEVSRELQRRISSTLGKGDSLDKVKQHLQSDDLIQTKYNGQRVPYENLTKNEQKVVDQLKGIRDTHNEVNYEIGRINDEQYQRGKGGTHAARIYDLTDNKKPQFGQNQIIDKNIYKARKNANDLSDDLLDRNYDEVTSTAVRNESVLRNKAAHDALDELAGKGFIQDTAPNKNFVQLDGRFGKYAGKFADRQVAKELTNREIFASGAGQASRDFLDSFRGTPIGKADQFMKATKTTLSPGTIVGNVASNIVLFARGSKINPITHTKNMGKAFGRLTKANGGKFDRGIYNAQKAGLDIGGAKNGFELNGIHNEELATLSKDSKNPLAIAGRGYGRMDDAHKLAMFEELQKRGMSTEQAARRTNLFSQDYNNIGRTINLFADSPILGKPFARFAVELLRLSKNTALYNPVGVAAGLGGLALISNSLSKQAGETDEQRRQREEQVGQTSLPGTAWINKLVGGPDRDLSLNLPIGDSAVNIARATGLNFPTEPGKNPEQALLEQLLPFPIPTRVDADGNTQIDPAQLVSSLTLKPLAEEVVGKDFMGRSITDPKNTRVSDIADKNKFEDSSGKPQDDGKDNLLQRAAHVAMSTVPLANEANNLFSAATGQEDYYGKTRTVSQAVARTLGVKVEGNTPAVRDKRASNESYFEGSKKDVNEFVTKNPDLADSYYKFNNPSRDRNTNTKTGDLVSPERWSLVNSDKSGRLYNFLKSQATAETQRNPGKPIDPVYSIDSPERVKEVLELRSRPTGDDIEREEILRATTPWYSKFEKAEGDYYDANSSYYKKLTDEGKMAGGAKPNARVEAYGSVPHPDQTDLVKGYYQAKAQGEQQGKDYYKNNADQLSEDFKGYKDARLKEINAKRAIEGVSPISQDTYNNVTFGYEDDESKVAKELYYKGLGGGSGYARRGGSGKGSGGGDSSNPYKYAVGINAGGKAAKPKVSLTVPKSKKISVKTTKPKVSSKRSRV